MKPASDGRSAAVSTSHPTLGAALQNELHLLNTSGLKQQQDSGLARLGTSVRASDPLLLDEVYSIPTKQRAGDLPPAASSTTTTQHVSWGPQTSWNSCSSDSSSKPAIQPPGGSFTSSSSAVGNSAAVAAVAAYRRQYLGLDSALQGPVAAAAAGGQLQQPHVQTSKQGFVLKIRPNGMSPPDYGPQHIPGYLPRPAHSAELSAVPNLPAKSGTGMALPPAHMMPGSCCPPPNPELLVSMDSEAKAIIAERMAQRVLDTGSLINRLVFDSLERPAPAALELGDARGWYFSKTCSGAASASSSCRTTGSGCTTRSNSTLRDEPAAGAEAAKAAAAALQGGSDASAAWGYGPGIGGSWYVPQGPDDTTLVFKSRFECGNLRRAVQVYPFEYDLVLQPDINTRGHTQWYYFAVANMRRGQAYRFNIINLMKEDSLYNMGMLPLMHSEQQMREQGVGWVRAGSDVCYGPNSIRHKGKHTYFTLSFVMEFPHDDDLVHLAHCYPYSYTDLQQHLYTILKEPNRGFVLERCCMATSLAGNGVDLLTITAPADRGKPLSQRQGVVLSARVHPGETNSSWMMKGALQQLLASGAEADQLREKFVFKVVPMLNPDGVIVGNYRCSLAGLDLNRVWQEPDARVQPVIRAFKDTIRTFNEERELVLFCDMHGHSRKYGVFCYGCERKAARDAAPQGPGWPLPGSTGGLPGVPVRLQERMFPLMLYINAPDLFSYRSCNFKVQKSKAGTGRVVGFRELGLVNAFTMEASFCGALVGKFAKQHFNTGHLEDMGAALVRTLLDYWDPENNSAAELAAQLMAAGTGSGSNAAAAAAAQSALGLMLDLGGAGEDDDVCTDSDDESSEEEKPPAAARQQLSSKSSGRMQASAASDASGAAAAAAAASAAADSISSNVAQLSSQLMALLSGAPAAAAAGRASEAAGVASPGAALSPSNAAASVGGGAAGTGCLPGSAVAALLLALKATSGGAAAANSNPPAGQAAGAATALTIGKSSRSSSQNASSQSHNSTGTAAAAAQQLLAKLLSARAKMQDSAAAAPAVAVSAAGADSSSNSTGSTSVSASTEVAVLRGASSRPHPRAVVAPGAANAGAAVATSAATGAAGYGATAGAATGAATGVSVPQLDGQGIPASVVSQAEACSNSQLTGEEAALMAIPGLMELLQQLVDEQAALAEAVAAAVAAAGGGGKAAARGKGGKKKGRRRALARYGNPEVLRAARAKGDASLAAALPELGDMLNDGDEAADEETDRQSCCSNGSSTSAAFGSGVSGPQQPDGSSNAAAGSEWPSQIKSGRRANASAGGRGSKGGSSMLDAERYINLLDKQKRHTGGVLASSSIDDPWAGGNYSSSSNSTTRTTSSFNSTTATTSSFKGMLTAAAGSAGSGRSSSLWASVGEQQQQQQSVTGELTSSVGQPGRISSAFAYSAAAAAAATAGSAGAWAAATDPHAGAAAAAAAGAVTGRRSKSAHAWLQQDSFSQRLEAVQAATGLNKPLLESQDDLGAK